MSKFDPILRCIVTYISYSENVWMYHNNKNVSKYQIINTIIYNK